MQPIYVLCPDHNKASGGVKILYRHVDVLNRCGFNAVALHQQMGFRCTWFENSTRIAYLPEVQLGARDFLVIPEVFGPNINALRNLSRIGRAPQKVIFNQNAYYTFLGHSVESVMSPAFSMPYKKGDEFVAAIVVSDDSRRYLEYAFPEIPVYRIHNAINEAVFSCQPQKKPQICFMPRKHPEDALQVLGILKSRGALKDFSVIPIENRSETEVAAIMRDSLVFLSFGYPEGCPLPPAEAMSSGCIVVGYHGSGGEEYFHEDFCHPVANGDILGYVQAVESVINDWRNDREKVLDRGRSASRYIREVYSAEREESDIHAIWSELTALSP